MYTISREYVDEKLERGGIKMGWFTERLEKFRKQSLRVIWITVFARFVLGMGLGALLSDYLRGYDW